jgi:hypothetical protein
MNNGDLGSLARQDVEALIELLNATVRQSIRDMEEDELLQLHHGLGMWLRNQFRAGGYPNLIRFCDASMRPDEARSLDAFSGIAIREIWRRLQCE